MSDQNCGNCRFSRDSECHKGHPLPWSLFNKAADPRNDYSAAWPRVHLADWCGEYQPRDRETPPPTLAQFMAWIQGGGYTAWLYASGENCEVEMQADAEAAVKEFYRIHGFPR